MPHDLNISKQNVGELFSSMEGRKFIIPDYQRNYSWDEEKCDTLWQDITDHHDDPQMENENYFLGTIVTCKNKDDNIEVIDGQQRVTSLLLLLRAFYFKLESMPKDDDIDGLKRQIEPCIWDLDPVSRKVKIPKALRIESLVATEQNNEVFHKILKEGKHSEKLDDLYSENYKFFQEKSDGYALNNPPRWYGLIVTILNRCIVLPIECDNTDAALDIFSTLNDRGMPLSDSDIFKAQIYRSKNTDPDKKDFIEDWQSLQEKCEQAKIGIDLLFRYYSHVLRAQKGISSKEKSLRGYYAREKYKALKENRLIKDLLNIGDFWVDIKNIFSENKFNPECRKFLHCLSYYPNDYWKYITTVFYKTIKLMQAMKNPQIYLQIFLKN